MRTLELDKHWSGDFYCDTCETYTVCLMNHLGHDLKFINNRRKDKEMIKRIDNKHSITSEGVIIKTSNGAPIPDHEPKILFRGRDKLALPMLNYYLRLCMEDHCTKYQEESMRSMIKEFEDFKNSFSDTMKQPGSTKGK